MSAILYFICKFWLKYQSSFTKNGKIKVKKEYYSKLKTLFHIIQIMYASHVLKGYATLKFEILSVHKKFKCSYLGVFLWFNDDFEIFFKFYIKYFYKACPNEKETLSVIRCICIKLQCFDVFENRWRCTIPYYICMLDGCAAVPSFQERFHSSEISSSKKKLFCPENWNNDAQFLYRRQRTSSYWVATTGYNS